MEAVSLFVLAVGLSMDAMAVSAARGLAVPSVRVRDAFAMALWFGVFQAAMPALGAGLGATVSDAVRAWDHFIAFALLVAIGAKMIHEARAADGAAPVAPERAFAWTALLPLAIATSIDAFAAGITLPFLGYALLPALLAIGATTFVLCLLGVYAGRQFGARLGRRLDAAGGILLILLGTKILVEHLST